MFILSMSLISKAFAPVSIFGRDRRKLKATASVKTAFLRDRPNLKKLIQTLVVYCLVMAAGFVHQPNAVKTVHFAVIPYPENQPGIACPRFPYATPHSNYRTGRNRDRKGVLLLWFDRKW
jgi:hypothetical protein